MTHNDPPALLETSLGLPKTSGKVRDVYDLGDEFLIVSTDRISAFDWILPSGIPDKGRVLTQLSRFWFGHLDVEHHLLATDLPESLAIDEQQAADLQGRVMRVRKAEVIPFECVVRGYLEGSGWREYQDSQAVCGIELPPGLEQCSKLAEPIFTPATKAEEGHDENVSFETMANAIGIDLASQLRELSFSVYQQGCRHAEQHGIIIADTKFEFGWHDGRVILIDEVLTPDSSRFWSSQNYTPGSAQPSFDKQFVREWLMDTDWDRNSPPPELPGEVVSQTRQKYVEVFEQLTGANFDTSVS
ncbi:MAG: phosphoribosylaminoimidazolesuccinocarboxamide synthase [Planctomycetota bacterium]